MMEIPSSICTVCNRVRVKGGHIACSKFLQQKHSDFNKIRWDERIQIERRKGRRVRGA
jgi:hypothetical protein